MKNLLCLEEISLIYHSDEGETHAIQDLSFCLNEGEFLSIVGPSGCGKTTILSLISGLIKPTSGTIKLAESAVSGNNSGDVSYMLQKDHLFEWRTIRQNVRLGLEIQRKLTPDNLNFADALLTKYGLGEFVKHYPRQLSGGMRQRVALIRTLATNPKLLLLDEPFSALDYQTRLSVCDDVHRIITNEHKSAILVTHDISEAISLSDRIVVLTPRPAKVSHIYEMSFPGCATPLSRREHKDFAKWFDIIWKELKH